MISFRHLTKSRSERVSYAAACFGALLCVFFAAAFFPVRAAAANVTFAVTNSLGQPDTNNIKLVQVLPQVRADGSYVTTGYPFWISPTNPPGTYTVTNMTAGVWLAWSPTMTNQFAPGLPGGPNGVMFLVDNSTNTYPFTRYPKSYGNGNYNVFNWFTGIINIIGTNGFVITVTNGVATLDGSQFTATVTAASITNGLGYIPANTNQVFTSVVLSNNYALAPPVFFVSTNFDPYGTALAIGLNVTNYANQMGQNGTNNSLGFFVTASNFSLTIGGSGTNFAFTIGGNVTNQINSSFQTLSNLLYTFGNQFTNEVLLVAGNNSNYTAAVGGGVLLNSNATKYALAYLQGQYNASTNYLGLSGGSGTYALANGTNIWNGAGGYTNINGFAYLTNGGTIVVAGISVAGSVGGYPVGSAFTNISGSGTLPTSAFFTNGLVAGANVTLSTNQSTVTITSSGTGGGGGVSLLVLTNNLPAIGGSTLYFDTNWDAYGIGYLIGAQGTNFSLLLGQQGTNYANLIGLQATNSGTGFFQTSSNFALTIGTAATNSVVGFFQTASNFTLTIGLQGTNSGTGFFQTLSNLLFTVAGQLTNDDYVVSNGLKVIVQPASATLTNYAGLPTNSFVAAAFGAINSLSIGPWYLTTNQSGTFYLTNVVGSGITMATNFAGTIVVTFSSPATVNIPTLNVQNLNLTNLILANGMIQTYPALFITNSSGGGQCFAISNSTANSDWILQPVSYSFFENIDFGAGFMAFNDPTEFLFNGPAFIKANGSGITNINGANIFGTLTNNSTGNTTGNSSGATNYLGIIDGTGPLVAASGAVVTNVLMTNSALLGTYSGTGGIVTNAVATNEVSLNPTIYGGVVTNATSVSAATLAGLAGVISNYFNLLGNPYVVITNQSIGMTNWSGADVAGNGTYEQISTTQWGNTNNSASGQNWTISTNGSVCNALSNGVSMATASTLAGPWTLSGGIGNTPGSYIGATMNWTGIHGIGQLVADSLRGTNLYDAFGVFPASTNIATLSGGAAYATNAGTATNLSSYGGFSVSIPNTTEIIATGWTEPFINGNYFINYGFTGGSTNNIVITGYTNSSKQVIYLDALNQSGLTIASNPPDLYSGGASNLWYNTGDNSYPGGPPSAWQQLQGVNTPGGTQWGSNITAQVDGKGFVYVNATASGSDANPGTFNQPFRTLTPIVQLAAAIYPTNLNVYLQGCCWLPNFQFQFTNVSFYGNGSGGSVLANPNNNGFTGQYFFLVGSIQVSGIYFSNTTITLSVPTNGMATVRDNKWTDVLAGAAIDDTVIYTNGFLFVANNKMNVEGQGLVLATGPGGGKCKFIGNIVNCLVPIGTGAPSYCLQNFCANKTVLYADGNTFSITNFNFQSTTTNSIIAAYNGGEIDLGVNQYLNLGVTNQYKEFSTTLNSVIKFWNPDGTFALITNNVYVPYTEGSVIPTAYVGNGFAITNIQSTNIVGILPVASIAYRAGTTNVANLATSQQVTFSTPFQPGVSYALSLTYSNSTVPTVSLGATAETTNGFLINVSTGIAGGSFVQYTAFPNQ